MSVPSSAPSLPRVSRCAASPSRSRDHVTSPRAVRSLGLLAEALAKALAEAGLLLGQRAPLIDPQVPESLRGKFLDADKVEEPFGGRFPPQQGKGARREQGTNPAAASAAVPASANLRPARGGEAITPSAAALAASVAAGLSTPPAASAPSAAAATATAGGRRGSREVAANSDDWNALAARRLAATPEFKPTAVASEEELCGLEGASSHSPEPWAISTGSVPTPSHSLTPHHRHHLSHTFMFDHPLAL